MSRHRTNLKKLQLLSEIGLHMECDEEELEPCQIDFYSKAEKEYNEIQSKLDNYIKKWKAEIIEKGEHCMVLQLNATKSLSASKSSQGQVTPQIASGMVVKQTVPANQNYQQMAVPGIPTRSNASPSSNTYVVMNSSLGLMVGQMEPSNAPSEQIAIPVPAKTLATSGNKQSVAVGSVMVSNKGKNGSKKNPSSLIEPEESSTSPITRNRDKGAKLLNQAQHQLQFTEVLPPATPENQPFSGASNVNVSSGYKVKMNAKQISPLTKPSECNAIGGLSAGDQIWKSISEEAANSKSTADSEEISFNKVTGKTFPSLIVVARPHLKAKYIPQAKLSQERSALDVKVKGILMYTYTKFTEWLIQQGLIKGEQTCPTHLNNDLSPVKLKLGMYNEVSKFPYSGGYVWISDCCPSQFVSVFNGSIFEGAPHPPTTLLKLIYHWACQTNIQNIIQWVKVDNLYVKNFFTNMRAVCTQAVQEKFKKMGGPKRKIEVGVISLGTTSQDGSKRQVKVEVLGVMDCENKLIRLKAVEPHCDERSFKKKFIRVLQPLEEWVCKDSCILTDFTVNKAALNSMGFHSVFQVPTDVKYSNQNVMEYLRKIVPRMFQNTLSFLSRQIIQQFLDELVWREIWGPIPSLAFANIIAHMSEQTKLDVSENLLSRLSKVAANPFKQWNYSVWDSLTNNKNTLLSLHEEINSLAKEGNDSSIKSARTRKRSAAQNVTDGDVTPSKKINKTLIKEKIKKEEKPKILEKVLRKEKTEQNLSDEIIKFINEEKQISLENYYYGTKKGENVTTKDSSHTFDVKCSICYKRFFENIVFMKHIILHWQVEPPIKVNLKNVEQCNYCFLGFDTISDLKTHLQEIHFVNNSIHCFLCQICEQGFNSHNDLVFHMHKTHVELEMPYECGVCHFRTSIYKFFVEHFTQIHKNEGHVFCPYCLKVVTLSVKGNTISSNVMFYTSHLEKHLRISLIKDCDFCQLSFIHKGILQQHMEADHDSWKGLPDVEVMQEVSTGLLMPQPGDLIKRENYTRFEKFPKAKNLYLIEKYKTLKIFGLDENSTCIECEEFLFESQHFIGSFSCSKCQYSTCCEKAISEHMVIFHDMKPTCFTIGKPTILPAEMFCICGYSSTFGNKLAAHLIECDKTSVYNKLEAVLFDSPSSSSSEEITDSNKGDTQNVLDTLGLVRKSPDVSTATEQIMEDKNEPTVYVNVQKPAEEELVALSNTEENNIDTVKESSEDSSKTITENKVLEKELEGSENIVETEPNTIECNEEENHVGKKIEFLEKDNELINTETESSLHHENEERS